MLQPDSVAGGRRTGDKESIMKSPLAIPIGLSIFWVGFSVSCNRINPPSNFLERFSLDDAMKEMNERK